MTNGNSLAGQSEGSLESFYGAFDATIMATSRNLPAMIKEPSNYSSSFINSSEEEVVPGIGYALITLGINPAEFPIGSVITVQFADGTTAQYTKVSNVSSYQWAWNGVAHNKQNQKINRGGAITGGTATAGGGSFEVSGFGGSTETGFGGGLGWHFAGDGVRGEITVEPPIEAIDAGVGGGEVAAEEHYD